MAAYGFFQEWCENDVNVWKAPHRLSSFDIQWLEDLFVATDSTHWADE